MPDRHPSIRAAVRTNRELGKLFGRLGTAEHPRGAVLVAYRNARRAMRDVLRRRTLAMPLEAREVMGGLKNGVRTAVDAMLDSAVVLGWQQAQAEAQVWELEPLMPFVDTVSMTEDIVGMVEQQERGILATLATGADPSLILGGDTTAGLLRPDAVEREGARWLTTAAGLALLGALAPGMQAAGDEWGKQSVAAIDDRTTECCLRVHGQVVPLDKQFHTTGTPAWAEWQNWSPFHWHCRTSVTIVLMSEADDDLTAMLLAQATAEIALRREAALRITAIMDELVELGTIPDARKRKKDTEVITELREELLELRQRGGYPGG